MTRKNPLSLWIPAAKHRFNNSNLTEIEFLLDCILDSEMSISGSYLNKYCIYCKTSIK